MHAIRQWITLVEDQEDDDDFLSSAQVEMSKRDTRGHAYWILADGSNSWIPTYGHHEDLAFSSFGQGERWESKSDEEMQAQYGDLLPNRQYISYTAVAMMHGWIRVILSPRKQALYIELIKGKAAPAAKRLVAKLIRAVEPYVQEYVVEYNTGAAFGTNDMVVNDPRKAIALL